MGEENEETPSVELIGDDRTFTLLELCRACAVDAEFVEAVIDQGILEPVKSAGHHSCFAANSLRRMRITVHLQQDLGVNLAGAALALDLLERIHSLDGRVRRVGGRRPGPED